MIQIHAHAPHTPWRNSFTTHIYIISTTDFYLPSFPLFLNLYRPTCLILQPSSSLVPLRLFQQTIFLAGAGRSEPVS